MNKQLSYALLVCGVFALCYGAVVAQSRSVPGQSAAVSASSVTRAQTTQKSIGASQISNTNPSRPAALGSGCASAPLPAGSDAQTVRCANGQWVPDYTLFNNGQAVGVGTTNPTAGFKLEVQGHEKVNGNLEVAGAVKGSQLCIGAVCHGSWATVGSGGTGGGFTNPATQALNMNLNEITNATKVYGREIEAANGPSSPYHTYLNYQNSGKNYVRGTTIFADIGGGNVGIGADDPTAKLTVNGGIKLLPATGRPTCNESSRGTMWFVPDSGDGNDHLYFCMKRSGNFQWLGN